MARRVVTLLFTDLEQSTRSWLEDEAAMSEALLRHDAILRSAVEDRTGMVLKHTGDGMVAVFEDPLRAAEAAVAAQRALRSDPDGQQRLRTRMALHTGPCTERDGDLFGPTLNRAARIMAAAHGGQVLVSAAVAGVIASALPLRDLGLHRLRDLLEPEPLHQLVVDDDGVYPPLRSLDAYDHNLPAQRTRLIGRDDDVATIRGLLERSRLVTLVGMGGVGKTRLAVEVAAQELDARSGVIFAELAPVASPDDVLAAVAAAAGLPPGDGAGDTPALVRLLAARPMLVLLDNCEHVIDASALLAETLLDECPGTVLLATSREPLGIEAESVWRVPSLPAPTAGTELFRERAVAVGADLPTDAATGQLIADVCERLDGIPLAIELAASRMSHLSLLDLADRLEERFRLLTGGRRRAESRQQTLQATLDWSHDLLTSQQQRVLRTAAAFRGGFTLGALEAVTEARDERVLDLLASLVDRSLVVSTSGAGGRHRYHVLETVRLYALERLAEAGEATEVRERHAAWVRSLLPTEVAPWPAAPPDPVARAERENVVAALDWVDSTGDLAGVGVLAAAGLGLLGTGTWVDDGWRYLDRPDVEDALEGEARGRYLTAGGVNANALGDFPRQAVLAERARATGIEPGSPTWRVATGLLANAASIFDPERSAALYEELLSTIPGDSTGELGYILARSADPALMTLDLEEGARRLDEALRVSGLADLDHGFPHLLLGRSDAVREAIELVSARADPSDWTGYRPLLLRALLASTEGHLELATEHLVAALRMTERLPVQLVDRDILNGFAVRAHHAGDHRRAAELLAIASAGPAYGRSPGMFATHMHYRALVRPHVDAEDVRALRAAASEITVADAIAGELARLGVG